MFKTVWFKLDDVVRSATENTLAWFIIIGGALAAAVSFVVITLLYIPLRITQFVGRRLGRKYTAQEIFAQKVMQRIENVGTQKIAKYMVQSWQSGEKSVEGYYPEVFKKIGVKQKGYIDGDGRRIQVWRLNFEGDTYDILSHKERGTCYETTTDDPDKVIRFLKMIEKHIRK